MEYKFRAWNKEKRVMHYFNLFQLDRDYHIEDEETLEKMPVMQFTGLKDKNGRDIYKDDIVKGEWQDAGETRKSVMLVGQTPKDGFEPFQEKRGKSSGVLWDTYIDASDFEIIGNIHENPELLKCS